MDHLHPLEPEAAETTRRGFFKLVTGVLFFLCTIVLAIPLVGSFIGPVFRKQKGTWMKEVAVDSLPIGQPVSLKARGEKVDAYLHEAVVRQVWVIRHSDTEVTVFSPICPHLGCHFNWIPSARHFVCPCHGSVYSITGEVLGGPAPRPLDTLPWTIEKGRLRVEWERFKVGIPQKVRI
jgi:menaquinol-cytochrome c reductase iron-sulfur subunit